MNDATPTTTSTPTPEPVMVDDKATMTERLAIIGIFGALAMLAFWKGDIQTATGFATTIGVYFLSRKGA
jgi:hypothetical protein